MCIQPTRLTLDVGPCSNAVTGDYRLMKSSSTSTKKTVVCPWWFIHSFDNPLRRLVQKPDRILHELVRPGDRCLDVGCGFGYFSIAMAHLVGPSGTVTAVDLQSEMLEGLRHRAERNNLLARIRLQQADASGLHIRGPFDFALAFWMMHEVPDQEAMLAEICDALVPGGRLLLVEPKVHVSATSFHGTAERAERVGFKRDREPRIFFSRSVVMRKAQGPGGVI
jgi:SAM-dependent methyltransferase